MRSSILLLVLSGTVLAGCSSAYKTGQTPDDVYFSPERQHDEYVNVKDNNDERRYYGNDEYYNDDQYLRMKIRNRMMWSELDDWYYYNPSYSYSYFSGWNWNNPWTPYTYWNYYYNPYCSPAIIFPKTTPVYNHPRIFNLNTFNNNQLANRNYTNPKGAGVYNNNYNNNYYNRPVRMVGVSNSNNGSSTGNFLRNIFNGSSSNNSNNSSSNFNSGSSSRSSSSSSSGSSGSSGGSAPVRKF